MTSADVVVPLTGQAVSLEGPTDELAALYHEIQGYETKLRLARSDLRRELLARMDKELLRKHQAGDMFMECDAPNQTEYDADTLSRVLDRLVSEDKISGDASALACKPVETLKVLKRGIDKLLASPALNEDDRAAILACAHPLQRERRLTVKKAEDR